MIRIPSQLIYYCYIIKTYFVCRMFVTSVLQNTSLPRCGCSLSISWGTKSCLEIASEISWKFWIKMEKWRCGAHKPIKNISTWGSILIENLLVEGHLYNQGCRKIHPWLAQEKVNQVRTSTPEGTQKKGRMHGQTPALRRDWFKLHSDAPVLRSRRLSDPWEDCWDRQKELANGKLGLHLWGARVWWLAQKVGPKRVCPGGWWVFPTPSPSEPGSGRLPLCLAWHWIQENHSRGKGDRGAQGPPGPELKKAC